MDHAFPMWTVLVLLLVFGSLLLLVLRTTHRREGCSERSQISFVTRLRAKLGKSRSRHQ
jgi:hypothetical protein